VLLRERVRVCQMSWMTCQGPGRASQRLDCPNVGKAAQVEAVARDSSCSDLEAAGKWTFDSVAGVSENEVNALKKSGWEGARGVTRRGRGGEGHGRGGSDVVSAWMAAAVCTGWRFDLLDGWVIGPASPVGPCRPLKPHGLLCQR
jgi:hypothetical protein